MCESTTSIKRRLSAAHGFRMDAITLLEAGFEGERCIAVKFRLNGVGMASDFITWEPVPRLDDTVTEVLKRLDRVWK